MLRNLIHCFQRNFVSHSSLGNPISLNNLKPAAGSNKPRKRVGRGIGRGGRTCGRGHKGQKSRSGHGIPLGFEGGQTPIRFRIPKSTRPGKPLVHDLSCINLNRLQHLIDTQRIDPSKSITIKEMHAAGIRDIHDGIKILGRGSELFRSKLNIQATCFSALAIRCIERLGGTATAVYHSRQGIRQILRPRAHESNLKLPVPMNSNTRAFYSNFENRGYLNLEVKKKLLKSDPGFSEKYEFCTPFEPESALKPFYRLSDVVSELRKEGILKS